MTDRQYPYQDGDVTVLGPEIFASPDGAVICWKGVNYERQAAAVVPAADRAALVELAAQAMREHYIVTNREEADADGNLPCCCGGWREPGPMGSDEDDYDSHLADAVLSVLPAPVDRSAVLREVADRYQGFLDNADTSADPRYWTGIRDMVIGLRRIAAVPAVGVAAETPPAFGAGRDSKTTPKVDSKAETPVHACPVDGSGITGCCGRVPFELPRTDRMTRDPDAVTCGLTTLAQRCANCGEIIRRVSGTLAAWWVHDPGGHTTCHPQHAAASTRAEPGPVVPAQPGKDTETRCTCADAGDCFAPAGHYADCPRSTERQKP